MAYDASIRDRAREFYVVEGLTFDEVAEATGVNASTLKRWSAEEGWRRRKANVQANLNDIQQLTIRLRKRLLEKALKSLEGDEAIIDPQKIFAVSALEGATAKLVKDSVENPEPLIEREIKTPADAVMALQEAVKRQVNRFLTEPGAINLKGIKEMKGALEMIDDLEKRWTKEEKGQTKSRGLSDEAAEEIRVKILGLNK
jgi:hypothetical protein